MWLCFSYIRLLFTIQSTVEMYPGVEKKVGSEYPAQLLLISLTSLSERKIKRCLLSGPYQTGAVFMECNLLKLKMSRRRSIGKHRAELSKFYWRKAHSFLLLFRIKEQEKDTLVFLAHRTYSCVGEQLGLEEETAGKKEKYSVLTCIQKKEEQQYRNERAKIWLGYH